MFETSIIKKIVYFLSVFAVSAVLYAEAGTCRGGYCFDCYDSSNGLKQNSVVAFGYGKNGFMFVAGRNSFLRFDGRNFVSPLENVRKNLPTTLLNDFAVASDGTAFLATDAGLWFFNSDKFEVETIENIDGIGKNPVDSLTFDKESGKLFGTVRGIGVFAFSKNSVEWFHPENSRLGTKKVNKVFATSRILSRPLPISKEILFSLAERMGCTALKTENLIRLSLRTISGSLKSRH